MLEQPKATTLEKIVVSFALPTDLAYHTIKSRIIQTEYSEQTIIERARCMYRGKIRKYERLLKIKQDYGGEIPEQMQNLCKKTPCGWIRLQLANYRSLP